MNYDQGVVMWSGSARAGELLPVLADFPLTTASSVETVAIFLFLIFIIKKYCLIMFDHILPFKIFRAE